MQRYQNFIHVAPIKNNINMHKVLDHAMGFLKGIKMSDCSAILLRHFTLLSRGR